MKGAAGLGHRVRAASGLGAGDRGAATVWAVGVLAVLMGVAVFALYLGGAMLARHQAESAADLAALAGAGGVIGGEQQACAQARRVSDRMRVRLLSCRVQGWDVLVEVIVRPGGTLGGFGEATGRARAGPAGGRDSAGGQFR
ncbi:MAG TPA: Rv3654c family TadE-like protein [Pseudonocardiaceae bacterium]|jgi:secretion/DNA translocation related TadE-like protein|nr:Rv3654c family TadE-like protein [Pseudonocardiaceae bacterium]